MLVGADLGVFMDSMPDRNHALPSWHISIINDAFSQTFNYRQALCRSHSTKTFYLFKDPSTLSIVLVQIHMAGSSRAHKSGHSKNKNKKTGWSDLPGQLVQCLNID